MQSILETFNKNITNFDNNSLIIRFILAFAVFYGHMFAIYGLSEPTLLWGLHSLGWYAVNMFFLMSGVLVAQSFEYRDVKSYALARFLRIYPAYVLSLFVSLLLALLFSPVDFGWQSFRFIISNILPLKELGLGMAGVWSSTAQAGAMNNSLWTIPFEVFCYIFIVPMLLSYKGNKLLFKVIFVIAMLYMLSRLNVLSLDHIKYDLLRVLFYFGFGVSFYRLIKTQSFNISLVFFVCGIIVCEELFSEILLNFFIMTLCLFISFYFKAWRPVESDYSYGIYLYAWPISQAVCAAGVENIYFAICIAFICLLLLSYCSWTYLEKPCLKLKNRIIRKKRDV